jgi:hypothetical protein
VRQLVSVVTDDAVRYFVQDGEHVQQIAQLLNPGLDVPAVIELGDVLTSALRLNGSKSTKRGRELPAAPEPAVRVEAAPRRQMTRPGGDTVPVDSGGRHKWGVTALQIAADVRAHPGTTVREITERLYTETTPASVGACSAHVSLLTGRGAVRVEQRESETAVGRRTIRRVYSHDHVSE